MKNAIKGLKTRGEQGLSNEYLENLIKNDFHKGNRWKKKMKPIRWNGLVFESCNALDRHLKIYRKANGHLNRKSPLFGCLIERISIEEFNEEMNKQKEMYYEQTSSF